MIISMVLILVARPISVYLCLFFFKISNRKKLFISWVGLRGAVPIILATYPLTAGVDKSNIIFNLVFFISITSILIQGTTLPVIGKWLNLVLPSQVRRYSAFEKELTMKGRSIMVQATIASSCPCLGRSIVDLSIDGSVCIASIERDGKYFTPEGTTRIQKGDRLSVLADSPVAVDKLYKVLGIEAGM
jgi:cell volume regulation protein A